MYRIHRPAWFALNEPRHYLILLGVLAVACLVIGGVRWTMTEPARQRQEQEHAKQVEHQRNVDNLIDAYCADNRASC